MAFKVQTASPGDSPRFTEAFLSTFSDDFNRTMFPDNPEVRAFLESTMLQVNSEHKHEILLKVTDPSNADAVAAFAKWIRPIASTDSAAGANAHQDRHENPVSTRWPASSDEKLCEMFFGTMAKHHEELMEGRPHYCTFFFCSLSPFTSLLYAQRLEILDFHHRPSCRTDV
jgi:hypothetical protein